MAQDLVTQTITVTDGSRSGWYYSPNNGASEQPSAVAASITIPKGWGLVAVTSVLLNANSTYAGGTAASITVRANNSSGVLIGSGSVGGNGDGSGNFTVDGGLRNTGISWDINDGEQYPLRDVTALWYQITMGGDASAVIAPDATGTSVQITAKVAPFPRRTCMVI